MTVTIKDIARLVQTTDATVSRALNDHPRISVATKERVHEVAKKLGYRPNHMGKSLKAGRTHVIGMLLPDLSNPFYSEIARQVENELAPVGLQVSVMESWGGMRSEKTALETMFENRCDGIIAGITLLSPVRKLLKEFWDRRFPCIVVGLPPDTGDECIDGLVTPIADGMEMAVEHLVGLGHRRIVLAARWGGVPKYLAAHLGFEAAIKNNGLNYDPDMHVYCRCNADQLQDGYEIGRNIMRDLPDTTAVIVLDNLVSMGVQHGLLHSGVKIPGNISLIGTDNSWLAQHWEKPLTTLCIDKSQYGKIAASLLKDRLKSKNWDQPVQRCIDVSLAIRESTGPVR